MRQLDPLFGGLNRDARFLRLPLNLFVLWLVSSALIGMMLLLFVHWSTALLYALLTYSVSAWLTRNDDKGAIYYWDALIRRARHNNKILGGISYDPHKKDVKAMKFTYSAEALKESAETERIPYLYHLTPEVIKLVNGDLLTTVKLQGINYETEAYESLALLKTYRNNMLMQLGEQCFMYVHYVRRQATPAEYKPFKNGLADRFLKKYTDNINNGKRFVNDIYVSLVMRAQDNNGLARLFQSENKNEDKLLTELLTAKAILLSQLERYEATALTIHDNGDFKICNTLGFLSYILNLDDTPTPYLDEDIRDYLSYTRKVFKPNGNILFNKNDGENRIAAMFGIPANGFPQGTDHTMLDPFLSLPHEMVLTMSFGMLDRDKSRKVAKDKQEFLEAADDDAISQIVDIDQVRDDIASGKLLNGMFNFTVMVHSNQAEDFKKGVEAVRKGFSVNNINPRKEDLIAEPSYYAQLPGNYRFNTRSSIVNSMNFAGFASMHNNRTGKQFGNHWREKDLGNGAKKLLVENPELGDYVIELLSKNNTPYYFNFHVHDVGHTRIVAPTGGGKTVLVNALMTASTKFNPYLFHFDYAHSAAPFIRAMGGQHKEIMSTVATHWNPLQLPDTPENRSFIYDFLAFIATKRNQNGDDIPLTAHESATVQDVVDRIYALKPELRRLRHILPFFGIAADDNLAQRIGKWVNTGAYAQIFDNEMDAFSIDNARMFGFEMKHIIDDGEVFPAVLMYILHRIDQSMTTRDPFIIVFEEGQRLVQNPHLLRALKNLLTTIRRRNGLIVFITPSPEVLIKDDDLRQQFKTSIYFPNPNAGHGTYCNENGFSLTEKEYEWIKTTDPKTREFLVKTDTDSITTRLDMSGMKDYLELFSGNDAKNTFITELEAQYGKDPNVWLPVFIDRFK